MRHISERVSYLQGLSEGLNVKESSPHGKIIIGMLGIMEEMAQTMEDMRERFEGLLEYLEDIDDDLQEMEEKQEEDAWRWQGRVCANCGEMIGFEPEVLDDEDAVEIICPYCDEVVFVNDSSFDFEPAKLEEDERIPNASAQT